MGASAASYRRTSPPFTPWRDRHLRRLMIGPTRTHLLDSFFHFLPHLFTHASPRPKRTEEAKTIRALNTGEEPPMGARWFTFAFLALHYVHVSSKRCLTVPNVLRKRGKDQERKQTNWKSSFLRSNVFFVVFFTYFLQARGGTGVIFKSGRRNFSSTRPLGLNTLTTRQRTGSFLRLEMNKRFKQKGSPSLLCPYCPFTISPQSWSVDRCDTPATTRTTSGVQGRGEELIRSTERGANPRLILGCKTFAPWYAQMDTDSIYSSSNHLKIKIHTR